MQLTENIIVHVSDEKASNVLMSSSLSIKIVLHVWACGVEKGAGLGKDEASG
jgi:hypothetical protein